MGLAEILRLSGDTIVLTPPFIVSEDQFGEIGEIGEKMKRKIPAVA